MHRKVITTPIFKDCKTDKKGEVMGERIRKNKRGINMIKLYYSHA
jgi:hypothetical protein